MITKVKTARKFAIKAHGEQKYGEQPYSFHLERVVAVLQRFGIRKHTLLKAAWLHDVLEDTATRPSELLIEFGPDVTILVQAVTNEPGTSRKMKALRTYPKIRRNPEAVILKLADRIANTEHSVVTGGRLLEMYRREFVDFFGALYRSGECDAMWEYLRKITLDTPVDTLPEETQNRLTAAFDPMSEVEF